MTEGNAPRGKRKGAEKAQLLPIRQDETIYAPHIDISKYLVYSKTQMLKINMGLKPDLLPINQPRHKCRGNS